jgi:transcriptional regulator with XRE-family HTH domain
MGVVEIPFLTITDNGTVGKHGQQEFMHSAGTYVGERLRARRVALGLSQKAVGAGLGISFQQVQKYEAGTNALNVDRLLELSVLLRVPVAYFFGTIEVAADSKGQAIADERIEPRDLASEREILEMARTFRNIRDKGIRRRLADLMRAIAVEP